MLFIGAGISSGPGLPASNATPFPVPTWNEAEGASGEEFLGVTLSQISEDSMLEMSLFEDTDDNDSPLPLALIPMDSE